MKKNRIFLLSLLIVIFTFSISSSIIMAATTIEDTTVSVDEGDSLIYNVKDIYPYENFSAISFIGTKINFTVGTITKGVDIATDALIMDCTIQNFKGNVWLVNYSNSFYMAANQTLNYLRFGSYLADAPIFFVIPTPINLVLVAEYLVLRPDVYEYTITGNTIHTGGLGSYKLTYDENGILTLFVVEIFGLPAFEIRLETSGPGGVSFSFYFLIFTTIGIIGIIYFYKKRK